MSDMSGNIWIEIDDLVDHISYGRQPSGIQRLEFELCRALVELPSTQNRINFIAFDPVEDTFKVLDWSQVRRSYDDVTYGNEKAIKAADGTGRRNSPRLATLKRIVSHLPSGLRYPIISFAAHQLKAAGSLMELCRNLGYAVLFRLRRGGKPSRPEAKPSESALAPSRPGRVWNPAHNDVLVSFGATWRPQYPIRIEKARRENRLRFAMMFHDIIPLRRPEWVDPKLVAAFGSWVQDILPLTDVIFTNSNATAADVTHYAGQIGFDVRDKVHPVPIGTGFSRSDRRGEGEPAPERPLPPPGSYVLVVSTIEPRKNHSLLFRVWRSLLEDLPADRVPTLVFAGGVGWLTSDFMQQLKNANFLNGKIVVVEKPTDAELETLYAGCQYTIYPSFYEGWGLPVTESHAYQRPCLASNRTSIPEAGGTLARYFDPDNAHELYRHVRHLIEEPESLRRWQEQIISDFKPTPWSASARTVLRILWGQDLGVAQERLAGPGLGAPVLSVSDG
jgi:glycosyltransferase involved in cell wall biosynthesis